MCFKFVNGKCLNAAEYSTMDIETRLRAFLSDYSKSRSMYHYKQEAENNVDNITCFFNSDICKKLKEEQGIFNLPTDIAMGLSCDAYSPIGAKTKRKPFSVSPIVLVCYNIEPGMRTKKWNVMVAGLIPGPKTPKRLDTFLIPILEEFRRLGTGVQMWHEYLQKVVSVRAFLVTIFTDMVAREDLARTLGNRAKAYCGYCEIIGLTKGKGGGLFCPRHKPIHNVPTWVIEREKR